MATDIPFIWNFEWDRGTLGTMKVEDDFTFTGEITNRNVQELIRQGHVLCISLSYRPLSPVSNFKEYVEELYAADTGSGDGNPTGPDGEAEPGHPVQG